MTFATKILDFYSSLEIKEKLPAGVGILNPYKNKEVMEACTAFYQKYYNDDKGRVMILGINPGRFGAGITGIPFTDPVRLNKNCGIKNNFEKRGELSSDFVYRLIDKMGGPDHFYRHFYIGAVSPLGFIKDGKNYNYYDSRELTHTLKSFILKSLVEQISLGIVFKRCYVLGQGKNYEYLKMVNLELKLFDELIPLPHPRWVMQYKRRQLNMFLDKTVTTLIT
ncbi:MAG: DUF4918 domain-containing protein [Bacteroidetes bacterium]|nr:MAG: DUF4918 domain-containing protein [Bacteroidota bacterium]